MPSITTHHMFSKELLKHLTKEELKRFDKELTIYHTFAQSHDYLFYYTFDIKNALRIRSLGHKAHHEKTQDYIINIVKEIKDNHLEKNQQALSYLYGSITHYCLDSTCHPYIFYKTGIYRKNNPNSKKFRGEHNHMEKDLDAIFYERYTGKKYNTCNLNKDIIKKPIFEDKLITLISNVYKKTYNENNIGIFYYKSIKHTKIINFLAINDRFGIKRVIYKFIDFITKHKFGYIQAYSTYILKPNTSFLNKEHKTWNHPSNKEITYNYSFDDLYNQALDKSLKIIREINKVLYENKDFNNLYKYIPDIDYSTGVIIEESRRMDFFEE